jgi:hypothetical protein
VRISETSPTEAKCPQLFSGGALLSPKLPPALYPTPGPAVSQKYMPGRKSKIFCDFKSKSAINSEKVRREITAICSRVANLEALGFQKIVTIYVV